MTPDRADRILSSLDAVHAEANAFLDDYMLFVRQRDGLGGQPINALRQCHVDGRAGLALNLRRALELARADLEGTKALPANDAPSVPTLFQLESGVTADLTPRQAAQQLKGRRHG